MSKFAEIKLSWTVTVAFQKSFRNEHVPFMTLFCTDWKRKLLIIPKKIEKLRLVTCTNTKA